MHAGNRQPNLHYRRDSGTRDDQLVQRKSKLLKKFSLKKQLFLTVFRAVNAPTNINSEYSGMH